MGDMERLGRRVYSTTWVRRVCSGRGHRKQTLSRETDVHLHGQHALSIPLFLPFLSSFRRDIFTLTTFSPTYTVSLPNTIETFAIDNLPGFPSAGKGLGIAIPSAWIAISANLFTQGMCIRGVNRLTAVSAKIAGMDGMAILWI